MDETTADILFFAEAGLFLTFAIALAAFILGKIS